MSQRLARDLADGKPVRVSWSTDILDSVEPAGAAAPGGAAAKDANSARGRPNASGYDEPSDLFVAPGLIDVQINGFAGVNYGDPNLTVDQVRTVDQKLAAVGVTHYLPTLITDSVERMAAAVGRIRNAAADPELRAGIVGIHLEGPYLSSVDGPRGAHPLEHTKDPDWEEFSRIQESAGGLVKLVTLAPERNGALRFIEQAVKAGIRISIGHTAASRQQILDAISAGASLSTHLGNAAHDQLQRHHNYIYDQLADDRLYASIIVDGHHLPPHLVKIFWRVKGPERTILTSDAVQYAGLPPGVYDGGYRKFEVRADGFIGVLGEPRLAGSGLMLIRGVENLVSFAGATLADAVRCATEIPARFLGIDDKIGQLRKGSDASLIVFRWQDGKAMIVETIRGGKAIYKDH